MPFLGNTPAESYISFAKQDITGNGGTSYSLNHPVTNAADIELFVNNVQQEPTTAYTVSGSTLTLSEAIASTDDCYCIFRGRSLQTVSPPDGSVTSAKLDTNIAIAGTLSTVGNVGIGTTSGTQPSYFNSFLNVQNNASTSDHASVTITSGSGGFAGLHFGDSDNGRIGQVAYNNADNALIFTANNSERMRLDSSGNLHVGKTATGIANAGLSLRGDADVAQFTRSGDAMLELNRLSNDGDLIIFYQDSSSVASIGVNTDRVYLSTANRGIAIDESGGTILPVNGSGSNNDNSIDLGASSVRFDDVFATNGTIQTSDQNEKQQIASLTTAEITAAKAISALFKTFKWNDKVEAKGNAARIHSGVIAQEVQTAMSNAGLDAANYAFWCSDTWTDDDGNSQTRMGIRYPELLAFVGAATEQRLANIETRLTALEAN